MRRCVLRGAWIVALWFFLVGRVVAAEFRIDRIDGEYVIDPGARAETLSPEQFGALAEALAQSESRAESPAAGQGQPGQ